MCPSTLPLKIPVVKKRIQPCYMACVGNTTKCIHMVTSVHPHYVQRLVERYLRRKSEIAHTLKESLFCKTVVQVPGYLNPEYKELHRLDPAVHFDSFLSFAFQTHPILIHCSFKGKRPPTSFLHRHHGHLCILVVPTEKQGSEN